MINILVSVLKIVVGSLIARYFNSPFAGSWWSGVLLLIISITGFCSFTGVLLAVNISLMFLTLLVTIYAVIGDSFLAHYFSVSYPKCNFPGNVDSCYCSQTERQFNKLIYFLQRANCDNIFVRNPELLILNSALSVLCFISIFILLILLLSVVISYVRSHATSDREIRNLPGTFSRTRLGGVRDYTVTV